MAGSLDSGRTLDSGGGEVLQSELDDHAADTTSVHGITDTSLLATTASVTALANAAAYGSILPSGYYIRTPGATVTTGSTSTGFLRTCPVFINRAVTVTRIGAEVTGAGTAGAVVRLGIYSSTAAGLPGTLLLDAGTIDGTSATYQEITISQALTPGLYWLTACTQVASSTLRVWAAGGAPSVPQSTNPTTNVASGFRDGGNNTGALPSTFVTLVDNATPVVVVLKVA